MLFRRSDSFLSALCLHRRARVERSANSVHAPIYQLITTRSLSLSQAVPLSRAMHSTTPPPKLPISPAPSSRWKRGRPVSAHYKSTNSLNGGSPLSPQHPLLPFPQAIQGASLKDQGQILRASHAKGVYSGEDGDEETALSNVLQHMQLGDDARTICFTPTARREALHAMDTMTCSKQAPQLHTAQLRPLDKDADLGHSEQTKSRHVLDAEEKASTENEPPSQHSMIELDSDADYLPGQTKDREPTEHLKEKEEEEDGSNGEEDEAEEHTDLEYQIPQNVLRAAMQASPNTRASFWSDKMYCGPEGQPLLTHYCQTFEVAERVAQYFLEERVLGFDIEWKPQTWTNSIKTNASLIQLACEDRIALFHISLFEGTKPEELMPPTLKIILESPDIYKVGVVVKNDFSRLQKYLNIQSQGVFELSRLHNLVELHATTPEKIPNKLVGLAAQVHQHLQLPLYKGAPLAGESEDTANVRESDWSKPLDRQQIHYAATDAYAGFRLYHMLEWKRKQLRPTPPTRGICDYDAKPKPKARTKKKATGKARDSSDITAEQSTSALEQELDDAEEEDAYETAPEEVGDPAEVSEEQPTTLGGRVSSDETGAQKRVGRVNLSWLRGPDPGYPDLPQETEEHPRPLNSSAIGQYPARCAGDIEAMIPVSDARLPTLKTDQDDDDEFADPELEAALQILDLDTEGKLREVPINFTESRGNYWLARSANADEMDNNDTTAHAGMLDYNSIALEAEELITALTPTFQPLTSATDEPFRSPEYIQATHWAEDYLRSTVPSTTSTAPSRIRATVPHLRAYHLWNTQQLSLDDIASRLRDPPLSHSTVTGYIMQAVTLERLEYDKEMMQNLMMSLPVGLRKGRWKWIAEKVGATK